MAVISRSWFIHLQLIFQILKCPATRKWIFSNWNKKRCFQHIKNFLTTYRYCENIHPCVCPPPPHLQIRFAASALIKISPLKFLMSIFKWQVNSVSNFASFFIIIKHNSPLSFKLTHFLLCKKGSNESPNYENFMCSGENLANSSCHFQTTSQFFFKFCTTLQCHEI